MHMFFQATRWAARQVLVVTCKLSRQSFDGSALAAMLSSAMLLASNICCIFQYQAPRVRPTAVIRWNAASSVATSSRRGEYQSSSRPAEGRYSD
jgi:hypothetical protein